jgi:hypothetical protein
VNSQSKERNEIDSQLPIDIPSLYSALDLLTTSDTEIKKFRNNTRQQLSTVMSNYSSHTLDNNSITEGLRRINLK